MIARIFLLLLIHNITIPVFDINLFLNINCYKKTVPFLTEEGIDEHLFCENFIFSSDEIYELQSRHFVISNDESVVFQNCITGAFNHKFLKKFPKAISIQLNNVTFTMTPSRSTTHPLSEISIYGGHITQEQNYRTWNNLTELRTFILGRTSGSYTENKTIGTDFFQGNKKLESIKIFKEDIEYIEDNALEKLYYLQSISLTDLKLKSLPTKLFSNNTFLEFVNLSGNLFGRFPTNFFPVYTKYMTLIGCNITKITEMDFIYRKPLQFLILDDNKISNIQPNIFKGLIHLRYLSIAGNQLRNITFLDFGNLEELQSLNVEWNYLNTSNFLPDDWKNDDINIEYLNQWN